MSTKDKKPLHPEVTFLPPLEMVLAFLDKKKNKRTRNEEASDEKSVEKLIEKLSEKEEDE